MAVRFCQRARLAFVAQGKERNVPSVEVAGSNPAGGAMQQTFGMDPMNNMAFQLWGTTSGDSLIVVAPIGFADMARVSTVDPIRLLEKLSHNSYALPSFWEGVCAA